MEKKINSSYKNIILVVVLVFALLGVMFVKKTSDSKIVGTVSVSIVDIDDNTLKTKDISFTKKDTLVSLVKDNFENVTFSEKLLYSIDEISTSDDWSVFVAIFVNGEFSDLGIDEIILKDKDVISFRETVSQLK